MAVPRKAMTEGIRTSILPGILSSRTFTIPQSQPSVRRLCQLPLHKGAVGAPAPVRFLAIGCPRFAEPGASLRLLRFYVYCVFQKSMTSPFRVRVFSAPRVRT